MHGASGEISLSASTPIGNPSWMSSNITSDQYVGYMTQYSIHSICDIPLSKSQKILLEYFPAQIFPLFIYTQYFYLQIRKALVVLAQLSRTMAEKMDKPIFHIRGWINGQIIIPVARYYLHIILRARLPSPLWDREPNWDPESVIGLAY